MAFLEFFMDLKLNYDVSYETDKIGPTTNPLTDIEDEMTREKLPFLYDVAMTMRDGAKPEVQLGIWRLVVDKLIDRTGMSNKEFSVWASRILAEGGMSAALRVWDAQSSGRVTFRVPRFRPHNHPRSARHPSRGLLLSGGREKLFKVGIGSVRRGRGLRSTPRTRDATRQAESARLDTHRAAFS